MTYTNLELASMGKVPLADELLGSWEIVPNPHSTSQAERSAALVDLGFGKRFSDHMAHATWTAERGWHDFRIEPYEAIAMSPAAPPRVAGEPEPSGPRGGNGSGESPAARRIGRHRPAGPLR